MQDKNKKDYIEGLNEASDGKLLMEVLSFLGLIAVFVVGDVLFSYWQPREASGFMLGFFWGGIAGLYITIFFFFVVREVDRRGGLRALWRRWHGQ